MYCSNMPQHTYFRRRRRPFLSGGGSSGGGPSGSGGGSSNSDACPICASAKRGVIDGPTGGPHPPMGMFCVVVVCGGFVAPIIIVLVNTIGGDGKVVRKSGNFAVHALTVLIRGIPATDGGTAAAATAGPTRSPMGTVPIGGGVGGGKLGIALSAPIGGGGTIGANAGKNASEGPAVKVSAAAAAAVVA